MRATITADAGRGPGCAVIVIADAPETAGPAFLLRRASDQKSLTTAGWQENETRLSPDHWERQGADLRLLVGPAVVDALDDLDAYRLTLVNAAPCVLQVGPLVYSPMRGGHGLADAAPTPAPDPEPEPAPSPTPQRRRKKPLRQNQRRKASTRPTRHPWPWSQKRPPPGAICPCS
ncbi:hypothetical protein [uncultured Desulfovibrio sp.]|uniref:hypothetical protein n=1 Tax=uncultured Desulfovibrio sp. TaxID=167968 RepID=UPI0026701285|nr:hypothetical protein [uncultured Desulfovibrio sp.]